MTVYVRGKRLQFKWLFAFVVFVLAMTVTFDEVLGLCLKAFKIF